MRPFQRKYLREIIEADLSTCQRPYEGGCAEVLGKRPIENWCIPCRVAWKLSCVLYADEIAKKSKGESVCGCGVDDVTTTTCPAHKDLV